MSPEKSEQLVAIYPELFSNPSDKSCINLFGFECCDGWFELLKDLLIKLKELGKKNIKGQCGFDDDLEYPPRVIQIKEKYGSLRFYLDWETEEISELIREAEGKSRQTCERCGEPGSIEKRGGWYSCLCDKCQ